MTRKLPDVQPCGERHTTYRHCPTCYPVPVERTERLQGPEVGAECIYRKPGSKMDGARCVVTARSYVWAPHDPAYHGGARRYDWKAIRFADDEPLPPFWGGRGLVVDDKDLEPVAFDLTTATAEQISAEAARIVLDMFGAP